MLPHLAIVATSSEATAQAKAIAEQLAIPLITTEHEAVISAYDFTLLATSNYLALRDNRQSTIKPIYIDFLAGKNAWRQRSGGKELLAKAVGYKACYKPYVIDTTAGLGRDAFVLASLGCRVLMLERAPVIGALLQDALSRLHAQHGMPNLQLIQTNAIAYLKHVTSDNRPDVIYLDPMYPDRTKTALVKKEMRILREIVGPDTDAQAVCQVALTTATKRVVVKRPRLAAPLMGKPDINFSGKHSRFDVYLLT